MNHRNISTVESAGFDCVPFFLRKYYSLSLAKITFCTDTGYKSDTQHYPFHSFQHLSPFGNSDFLF